MCNSQLFGTQKNCNDICKSNSSTKQFCIISNLIKTLLTSMIRNLKDFGFGKSAMEDLILDEAKELIIDLKSKIQNDNNVDINQLFNLPIINSLWKIITGKRLDINKPEEKQKISDIAEMFKFFGAFNISRLMAFILPLWIGKQFSLIKNTTKLIQRMLMWFRGEYEEHEKTLEPENQRDFLDAYITERYRMSS